MASLKEVKTRITSVKNTRKITSAMKMVASSKLHKMQGAIESMLPYQRNLDKILTNLLRSDLRIQSPYIAKRDLTRVAIVVFSSNASLCGAFNGNIIREFTLKMSDYKDLPSENILVFPVGRKIEDAIKRMGIKAQGSFQSLADKPSYKEASELAEKIMGLYLSGEVDRVELIYHHFKSRGSQVLKNEAYLPIDLSKFLNNEIEKTDSQLLNDYIIEPSAEELITNLLPIVLKQKMFTSAVDSSASEHAARTLAMQIATDNANDLIQELTKQYNKSRQQAITNELLDIVGGSMK